MSSTRTPRSVTARPARVIDTGVRGARENVAIDQALVDAHRSGRSPDTVRFLRFVPSVLVGRHQILAHEVRESYCARAGIEVGRRITGGGGLYLDERQLGWEVVLERRAFGACDLDAIAARICDAVALGLRTLGVPVAYRPRNDLEVDGRKIGGTGGFVDGRTVFYQGTLLLDFDADRMIEALRIPVAKLSRRRLADARERVVSLRTLLGHVPPLQVVYAAVLDGLRAGLGIDGQWGTLAPHEDALAVHCLREDTGTDAFVQGEAAPEDGQLTASASIDTADGGCLRADLRLEGPRRRRIREALLSGDVVVSPPRAMFDLEAALRGLSAARAGAAVDTFFRGRTCEAIGFTPADFREVIERALRQRSFRLGALSLRGHVHERQSGTRSCTLVFLHDALGSTRQWRDVPDRLVDATGCGALVFDREGAGESSPLHPPYRMDYLLHEARDVLPAVLAQAGVGDALLIGQSDGAAIALAYAGLHPARVRGVVALAPHLYPEARTLGAIREQIDDFERGDLRARLARHHGERTDALFARLVEVWTGDAAKRGWGLEPAVGRIACPVLAIQGEQDEFFSSAQVDALRALLGPWMQDIRVPGGGHYPLLDARDDLLPKIAAFVHSATRGPGSAGRIAPNASDYTATPPPPQGVA